MYDSAPFFIARSALLTNEIFSESCSNESTEEFIWNFYKNEPLFQEAIFLASPGLHESIQKNNPKQFRSVTLSLLKYFLRMCSRTTPFGLFSSVVWGKFSSSTNLKLQLDKLKKIARPDMEWLTKYTHQLVSSTNIIKKARVVANPSLVKQGSRIIIWRTNKDLGKKEQLSIKSTPIANEILESCVSPILYEDLEEHVCQLHPTHDSQKIKNYIWLLFKQGYLLSQISINCRQHFNFSDWIEQITASGCDSGSACHLKSIDESISKYQKLKSGEGLDLLSQLASNMQSTIKTPHSIQVDSFFAQPALTLSARVQDDIKEAAKVLCLLSQKAPVTQIKPLQSYHQRFLEKYGIHRLVPLEEVFNENSGLGQIDNYQNESFTNLEKTHPPESLDFLLTHLSREGQRSTEVKLENYLGNSISNLQADQAPISLELYFEIFSSSPCDVDKGEYTLALNPVIMSTQAGSTFARFLHLWGPDKTEAMKNLLLAEESIEPDSIIAEATFLPDTPRTINVAIHPPLRRYALCFHYHPYSDNAIYPSDIHVGADATGLYLYVPKLAKKLKVALSSAINPELAPPLLKFLLTISNEQQASFLPFWWAPFKSFTFLPRLTYKNIILCPSRWYINLKTLNLDDSADKAELARSLHEKCFFLTIPQKIYLTEHDHRLKLDRSNPLHFEILVDHLQAKKELVLFEALENSSISPVSSKRGHHVTEFVVPLIRNPCALKEATDNNLIDSIGPRLIVPPGPSQRVFLPGDRCLYLQIPIAKEGHEAFLRDCILSWISEFRAYCNKIERWFYIRYKENSSDHIRLRIFAPKEVIYHELMPFLHNKLLPLHSRGEIGNTSWHAYEREIERYGDEFTIELAEKFFHSDSECCCELLQLRKSTPEGLPLYAIAGLGILHIGKHFYSNLQPLVELLKTWRETKSDLLKGSRAVIREWLDAACSLLDLAPPNPVTCRQFDVVNILNKGTASLKAYSSRVIENHTYSSHKMLTIASSLFHMHCNRLLGIDKEQESRAHVFAAHLLMSAVEKAKAQRASQYD